jgi:hypothetical protein
MTEPKALSARIARDRSMQTSQKRPTKWQLHE